MPEDEAPPDEPAYPVPEANESAITERLNALVVNCPDLRELEKILGKFNLFRVLKFEEGEIRHSNVLAWLFNPEGSHGLRDLFLRRWLMRVTSESEPDQGDTLDPVLLDSVEIRQVDVFREWRNIDLLIVIHTQEEGQWVLTIENKVRAKQSDGQLERYRRIVDDVFRDAKKRVFLFLTNQNEESADPHYLPASFRQVFEVLKDCLEELRDVIGPDPKVMLNHYLALLEEHFMDDSRIQQLASKIYQSHREALDIIFEHRPDELQNLSSAVEDRMKADVSALGITPMACSKGYARFLPKGWDTPRNRSGLAWGATGSAYVLCEIALWGQWPQLKIVEGKAPEEWRNELWSLAQNAPFKRTQKRTKQPTMWMSVHTLQNKRINLRELELGQEDEVAEKIWNWVKEQLDDHEFKEAVTAVGQHIQKLA